MGPCTAAQSCLPTNSVSACRAQFARGQLVAADAASPLWTPELELVTADTDTSLLDIAQSLVDMAIIDNHNYGEEVEVGRNSKPKNHTTCLEKRLHSWDDGDINNLLLEGRVLQARLPNLSPPRKNENNLERAFSNLMLKGKTSAALQLLAQKGMGGILHVNDPTNSNDPTSQTVLLLYTVCYKRLASLLCAKWNQPYSSTMAWIRCRLTFSLLRSAIQCIRGARSAGGHASREFHPLDLISAEAQFA